MLGEAVRQCRAWLDGGLRIRISVNLSIRNLHDPSLLETLTALLQENRVDPSLLQIEITESTLMADPHHSVTVLRSLHEMGIELAIDDFGTGYSSLAYLRRLPVTEIKIDKSFVIDLATEENAAVIVRSTIDLGHNLGLKVVAEGVEQEATWRILEAGGCDIAQGNLFGPPESAEAVGRRLRGLPEPAATL